MNEPSLVARIRRRRRRERAAGGLATNVLNYKWLAIITVVGGLAGLVIPSIGALKQPVLVTAFFAASGTLFVLLLRGQQLLAFALAMYLCALQPAFRLHAPVLPYLAMQYVMFGFSLVFLQLATGRKSSLWFPPFAYGMYVMLEVAGSLLSEDLEVARSIVLPSLTMFTFLLASRKMRLDAGGVTILLAGYVTGAAALLGFALRSYLAGQITWDTESNFEASGGMPPNHISVLCSLAAFAAIVLAENTKPIIRASLLALATAFGSLMVLTFSRGGTVLLVLSTLLYYVILRQRSWRTVFPILAIAGIGLVVYYSTLEITGGKVAERFSEATTSNRLTIATQGLEIFFDHPLFGVGSGNFNEAITQTDYGRHTGAHNELVRAAAEHGVLGLLTWCLFAASSLLAAFRGGDPQRARRALRLVIWIFALTSMFYNGLKLMIQPSLMFLALAAFTAKTPEPRDKP